MDTDRIMAVVLSAIILLFGLVAVVIPSLIAGFLVMLIGIILLFIGILTAGLGLSTEDGQSKMVLLGSGLISIVIGLLAVITPIIATVAIGFLIAIWLVLNGVLTIAYAVSITWEKHRILSGLSGVISFLIGLYLFINPVAGTSFLILVLGIFFIISGLLSLLMSLFFWKR